MQVYTMIWCAHCTKQQQSQLAGSGLVCCGGCGRVVHQNICLEESDSINGTGRKGEKGVDKHVARKSSLFDAAELEEVSHDMSHKSEEGCDNSESLSDIDDAKVSRYLLKKEEKRYKKIIWEQLNLDYLKARADKKAAAAKAAKLKKERQRQYKEANKSLGGAKATSTMAVKRPSGKVNYDALQQLLDEPEASNTNAKKRRTDTQLEESTSKNDSHMEEMHGDYEGEEGGGDYSDWDQTGAPYDNGGDVENYGDYDDV